MHYSYQNLLPRDLPQIIRPVPLHPHPLALGRDGHQGPCVMGLRNQVARHVRVVHNGLQREGEIEGTPYRGLFLKIRLGQLLFLEDLRHELGRFLKCLPAVILSLHN